MMLALRLEYLTGRVVATAYNSRNDLEWPPHPSRLFSAFVAIWADEGKPAEQRAALQWLERQPAPAIACSDIQKRSVMTHFVPVNDITLLGSLERYFTKQEQAKLKLAEIKAKLEVADAADTRAFDVLKSEHAKAEASFKKAESAYLDCLTSLSTWTGKTTDAETTTARYLLPDGRLRQGRSFPCGVPDDPVVYFIWPDAPAKELYDALNGMAEKLVNLGHSSSLVHARFVEKAPDPTWYPDAQGEHILRWVSAGQLQRLEDDFARHQGMEPRVLPFAVTRYRKGSISSEHRPPASIFDSGNWLILRRVGGARLPLTRTAELAQVVRGALMRYADQPPATVLSGHESDGSPARDPHLAIVPLPNVGHRYSDGAVLGIALVMPRELASDQRRNVLAALGRWEAAARQQSGQLEDEAPTLFLGLGHGIEVEVERVVWGEPPLYNLRPDAWCAVANQWVSVTPVALDRNPGDLFSRNPAKREAAYAAAAEIVTQSCVYSGLPRPEKVVISPTPMVPGSAAARQFQPFPLNEGKFRRVLVHVSLVFSESVQGPVLLGAGRFYGLGLFRPLTKRGSQR